jgi:hypothetical protein
MQCSLASGIVAEVGAHGPLALAQPRRWVSTGSESMNLRKSVFIAVAMALAGSIATAAEAAWPRNSASDVSIFVTMLRFRIHAEHCSAKVPQLESKFDSLMKNLENRVQGISKSLLASDEFEGMKDEPVPAEIIDALQDSFDDGKHNLERLDAAAICPKALQNFGEMDDDALKSGLTANLKAVQNMIRKRAPGGA